MEKSRVAPLALLLGLCCLHRAVNFNLDAESPSVYSGPQGSYFGFAVDFFTPETGQLRVLVGAPKANTSGAAEVVERGSVYSCPWQSGSTCAQVPFDTRGNRIIGSVQMEFKSSQWFGASVRAQGDTILACAPLYQWGTSGGKEREPVGTCFLNKNGKVVEYSPCRTAFGAPNGQGFCQAGFSADIVKNKRVVVGGPGSFYWQGQLISDEISEIMSHTSDELFTKYLNQMSTRSAIAEYDDSYLGYSLAVGDCNNDGEDDYITGVPRGGNALGYVNVLNGMNMVSMVNFTGVQMAAYFGHSVAVTDVNNDGFIDLLVGAPLFMDRGSDGKLREVGQVYIYLGRGSFTFQPSQKMMGTEIYARFGSCIMPLGDLDMDGFNDVAIAAPYGGPEHQGLVYIHNGRAEGPQSSASQVLMGKWATSSMLPSFGYAMHGATDIDQNGYPDLLVGVFGADTAVLYRSRPVVRVTATLDSIPSMLNPEQKSCTLPGSGSSVSCFQVRFCLQAQGKGATSTLRFQVNLTLDRLKPKGIIKRVMFLQSKISHYSRNISVSNGKDSTCEELSAFLIDDSEFRDKITPIVIFMEYSLDTQTAVDSAGLLPILNPFIYPNVSTQAHILLDCGEDNICKPDLRLSVLSKQKQMYIGDDGPLTLEVTADNVGEGAYEAELHVYMPPQADFSEVIRNKETLSRISCSYTRETRLVVCDLGNPMKGGTTLTAGLRFSLHQVSDQDTAIEFRMEIVSSNPYNNKSNSVSTVVELEVMAKVEIRGNSGPDQVILPIPNWEPAEPPVFEEDIGPLVQHIYELRNKGPSDISKAMLDVEWPYRFNNGSLLYIMKYDMDGPMNCSTEMQINPLNVTSSKVKEGNATIASGDRSDDTKHSRTRRDLEGKETENQLEILDCVKAQCLRIRCQIGRLEQDRHALLMIYSRLAVSTFLTDDSKNHSYAVRSTGSFSVLEMPYKKKPSELTSNSTMVNTLVTWTGTLSKQSVPAWVIALAILAGLLLLALMILIMYKVCVCVCVCVCHPLVNKGPSALP
uniref:Integrin, alpha V n=1 Tax=Paramormyrops kingsleyae TaxID=1676925 RepID=A0A3B3SBJ2_9TELE